MNYLDLSLLKDLIYVNVVIGLTMSLYSDGGFFILLPMYLFDLGFTKDNAALATSIAAVAELLSRATLAVVSIRYQFKARDIFFTGSLLTTVIRLGIFNENSFQLFSLDQNVDSICFSVGSEVVQFH